MEQMKLGEKVTDFVKKYRYVALVLAVGILLMCWPDADPAEPDTNQDPQSAAQTPMDMAAQLERILSQVDGAGKVRVLLTQSEGAHTVYQTDRGSDGTSADTVLITDSDRAQQGLVSQIDPPVYLGAVIVCQGGADPAVRLALVEAVSDATGLGADRITVLKMK